MTPQSMRSGRYSQKIQPREYERQNDHRGAHVEEASGGGRRGRHTHVEVGERVDAHEHMREENEDGSGQPLALLRWS